MSGFVCLRLYTGPMYFKYNNVLRGVSVPGCKAPLEQLFRDLCKGNKYTNTLHAITASINKLSRVSRATKVYRAPGGALPNSFWHRQPEGMQGGLELAFMSTTTAKKEAMASMLTIFCRRSRLRADAKSWLASGLRHTSKQHKDAANES